MDMNQRTNETQLVCIARFIARDGEVDQLMESLHFLMAQTHQEGGCIRYELNRGIDNPKEITFIEKWFDQKTFDEHCAKKYIVDFFRDGQPRFVESFDVSMYKELLP
jgi:quinol monooxygenase YgiN